MSMSDISVNTMRLGDTVTVKGVRYVLHAVIRNDRYKLSRGEIDCSFWAAFRRPRGRKLFLLEYSGARSVPDHNLYGTKYSSDDVPMQDQREWIDFYLADIEYKMREKERKEMWDRLDKGLPANEDLHSHLRIERQN